MIFNVDMITGKSFSLEIVAPERLVYEGAVDSVTVPGIDGQFQMLFNHAPIISALQIGSIAMTDATGAHHIFAIGGGFVQMLNNKTSIVVESAEESTSIDIKRALEAKRRAEDRLRQRDLYDTKRAEISLMRALNRLRIAGYSGD